MGTKNNNNLFFTCSLIEYMGRLKKKTRCEITEALGKENIDRIYEYADVLHCERENAAEILLEAKGFSDVVVSITDNEADVVLNMGDVTDAKRAQVEDIVKRKTGISAENIVITPLSQ